ncbi:GlxA family transcriptional regulator [Pseudanabaena mucicola]|uniref:Helix-turn-helix domain-containing protein n=1 Tax=Pseudanabaena mucicola FACHB-723 TaxID=2692860 RepID=A0ABR7ZV27_9CYAN|nr:helix-turn-helix domain-containing protein [Pseudanabaena mucicola]MBD2187594.1 helix-turn-helix domain-containing protein [Pseudanabaena mucicola FACHB-723]
MFHVSLVALPNVLTGSLLGALDLFSSVGIVWNGVTTQETSESIFFNAEIVGVSKEPVTCYAGVKINPHQSIFDLQHTDIIYLPSITGIFKQPLEIQYLEMLTWICQMYQKNALICTSGSGALIMAETGLLDGLEATTHDAYVDIFKKQYPKIRLCTNQALVQTGHDQRLVTVGGQSTWHDLIFYIIARYAGNEAATQTAKAFLIQWHLDDKMLAHAGFQHNLSHNDRAIQVAQKWISEHINQPNTLISASQVAGLAIRTFNRRFKAATGLTPIAYIQNLRIEQAKIQLETTDKTIDSIGITVGYEDSSSFRVLFKRITGLTPSDYRRKFKIPDKVNLPEEDKST